MPPFESPFPLPSRGDCYCGPYLSMAVAVPGRAHTRLLQRGTLGHHLHVVTHAAISPAYLCSAVPVLQPIHHLWESGGGEWENQHRHPAHISRTAQWHEGSGQGDRNRAAQLGGKAAWEGQGRWGQLSHLGLKPLPQDLGFGKSIAFKRAAGERGIPPHLFSCKPYFNQFARTPHRWATLKQKHKTVSQVPWLALHFHHSCNSFTFECTPHKSTKCLCASSHLGAIFSLLSAARPFLRRVCAYHRRNVGKFLHQFRLLLSIWQSQRSPWDHLCDLCSEKSLCLETLGLTEASPACWFSITPAQYCWRHLISQLWLEHSDGWHSTTPPEKTAKRRGEIFIEGNILFISWRNQAALTAWRKERRLRFVSSQLSFVWDTRGHVQQIRMEAAPTRDRGRAELCVPRAPAQRRGSGRDASTRASPRAGTGQLSEGTSDTVTVAPELAFYLPYHLPQVLCLCAKAQILSPFPNATSGTTY